MDNKFSIKSHALKKSLILILCFFTPSFFLIPLLRLWGYRIGKNVKIGFSIINTKKLALGDDTKIGHFNLITNDSIEMSKGATIGYLNILKGPFDCILREKAALGNKNYMTRGRKGISYGYSKLELGELTKITIGHHLDLTQSITFGDFSILAGIKSQLWTHGYYHADQGKDRIRIDGEIHIGNNVYVGSGCIFNPGVKVSNAIHIGAGSVISKDLKEPGMYVGQALRYISNNLESVKSKLTKVEINGLIEKVYTK